IWLRMKRPKNSEPEYVKIPEPEKKIIKEQEVKKDTVQAIKISSPDTLSDKGVRTDKVVDRGQVHMVKAGETLYSISKTYGVQADSIRKWNSLPDNNLKPGQELLVKPAVKSSVVHKVVQGETLYKIARMYGVTPAEIRQWNGKTGDALETGEELIIKRR
ncbi:MAG: LysM peptidoglycan-binding domain-containing protein, partial [Cytophagaceae bacterium]